MPERRVLLGFAVALVAGGAALAWLVGPELSVSLASGLSQGVPVTAEVPAPVIAGGILVVGTLAWLAATWVVVRGASAVLARRGGSVTRLAKRVFPESTLWQFAVGLILLLLVVFLVVGVLPSVVGL